MLAAHPSPRLSLRKLASDACVREMPDDPVTKVANYDGPSGRRAFPRCLFWRRTCTACILSVSLPQLLLAPCSQRIRAAVAYPLGRHTNKRWRRLSLFSPHFVERESILPDHFEGCHGEESAAFPPKLESLGWTRSARMLHGIEGGSR